MTDAAFAWLFISSPSRGANLSTSSATLARPLPYWPRFIQVDWPTPTLTRSVCTQLGVRDLTGAPGAPTALTSGPPKTERLRATRSDDAAANSDKYVEKPCLYPRQLARGIANSGDTCHEVIAQGIENQKGAKNAEKRVLNRVFRAGTERAGFRGHPLAAISGCHFRLHTKP